MHAAADAPRRHRLTVDDDYRMAEVGILAPDARTELIDGEIIDMVPPRIPPWRDFAPFRCEKFPRKCQLRNRMKSVQSGAQPGHCARMAVDWRIVGG